MQHSSGLAKHRLERAKEHFQSAKELLANNHFLDSVSRSYYAVFSAARAVLATADMDSAKHSGVISLFDQHFVKTDKISSDASKIIHEAKDYREKADYADYPEITREIAESELVKAERFINEIESYIEKLIGSDNTGSR